MTARSGRRSVTIWSAASLVLVVVVALTGIGGRVPALAFAQAGHWVYNSTVGAVFHVDGASKSVDSKMSLPGLSPADQVVQDDQHGYVVDRRNGRILVFGKSTLSVQTTISAGSTEQPVSIEVNGGPYLVYEHGGRIVRLGTSPATISAGARLTTPVVTSDGTIWVQRPSTDSLCRLGPRENRLSCSADIPHGHHGVLAVLDDRPAFVDTSASTVALVASKRLASATPLGVALPADARVANADAGGRLPVLIPGQDGHSSLAMIDTSMVGMHRPAAKPITVPLSGRDFDTPMTSGGAVAVVDKTTHKILTYTNQGASKAVTALPAGSGNVALSRGEDGRIYIDNAAGTRTFIVDGDGSVTLVNVNGPQPGPPNSSKSAPPDRSSPPTTTRPPDTGRHQRPAPPPPTRAPTAPPVPVPPPPTTAAAAPPNAPPTVLAAPGDRRVTVTWTAPLDNGSPITSYVVTWRTPTGSVFGSTAVPVSERQSTIAGLSDGTTYVATVAARNLVGLGPATQSAPFVPNAVLTAPTDVTAKASTDGTVTVRWQAATRTAAGTVRFVVAATAGPTVSRTGGTDAVIDNLTPGHAYRFTVTATDGGPPLRSAASAPIVPFRAAAAPTRLSAKPGDRQVALSWVAPTMNGGNLVHYVVSGSGINRAVAGTTTVVTGLTAGTAYRLTVRAVTADPNGSGTRIDGAAASIAATPIALPRVQILDARWTGKDQMSIDVRVDDGGSPTTCAVVADSILTLTQQRCDSSYPIVINGVNSDSGSDVNLTVSGRNAAGTGPTSNTYDLPPAGGDDH